MSNSNDSGGGCLLWFIDFIFDIINNRRIRKYNKQSRGLEEYKSITTDILFPSASYSENIIISGGSTNDRLKFSERIISNSFHQDRSMIVLHLANGGLENIIARNNYGLVISQRNQQFDAFASLDLQEIEQLVLDTCKSKYEIKSAGRYILQAVFEFLSLRNIKPYFMNYANCPFFDLTNKISDKVKDGTITQADGNRLNSLLLMGQAECANIDSFFRDMKAQIDYIAVPIPNNTGGTSVLSAIKNGQSLCIDVRSSSNVMLIELIVNSLTIAMNRGYEFSFFLDDVAIANNDLLMNALCHKSNHNNVIVSKDLFALLKGKDEAFNTLVGEAEKTVLLSHGSHVSCEKWSKYIGEYDKIDVSHNTNAGWSQSSKWGYNSNQGKTMTDKREYKIKPEQINRLSQDEVFIYDNQTGSLIQTHVV